MPFDLVSQPLRIVELTLADVLAMVQTADLPKRQRQELASALRTVGRALDRPLERIQADPRHLAPRLKAVAPRAIGITARSWNNIRHRTRKALSLVRPMSPGRNANPLTPAWDALWRPLESRRVKFGLSGREHSNVGSGSSAPSLRRWCDAGGTPARSPA
jgi:hypothetical protein